MGKYEYNWILEQNQTRIKILLDRGENNMKIEKNKAICFGIFFVLLLMTIGSATAGSERNSVIYEDRIVWQDDSNGNWDIQMYNISTSTKVQITNNDADQQNPDILSTAVYFSPVWPV
jgi:beta propeller repeat protein